MLHSPSVKSPPSASFASSNRHYDPLSPLPPTLSPDDTPRSSSQGSPSPNLLTREYRDVFQSTSYNEIRTISSHIDHEVVEGAHHNLIQSQLLQPNRESVEDALRHAKPNTPNRLISDYFNHSEDTTFLCRRLQKSIHLARQLYQHLHALLDVLPLDSLSQPQIDCAFDEFKQFYGNDNPFPGPHSNNFNQMRHSFSQLKQQIDRRLRKSNSRIRLVRHSASDSALCSPTFCTLYIPPKFVRREIATVAQLNAAARGTFALNTDIDTLDRRVTRLHTAIEGDREFIRLGLERGRDKHPIQEVLKLLRKNRDSLLKQLMDLEDHTCLCFRTVNRTRSTLFDEISLHRITDSS